METSIFIARILATVYFTMALGILFNPTYYKKELPKLLDNNIFVAVYGGFLAIVFGGFIVYYLNNWNSNVEMLIAAIGWISLLKGILLFVFPTRLKWYREHIFTAENLNTVLLPILIVFGLLFTYFGFLSPIT